MKKLKSKHRFQLLIALSVAILIVAFITDNLQFVDNDKIFTAVTNKRPIKYETRTLEGLQLTCLIKADFEWNDKLAHVAGFRNKFVFHSREERSIREVLNDLSSGMEQQEIFFNEDVFKLLFIDKLRQSIAQSNDRAYLQLKGIKTLEVLYADILFEYLSDNEDIDDSTKAMIKSRKQRQKKLLEEGGVR